MRYLNKSKLRYPGLWKGCVGAWAPFLGSSGTMLRDWSGQNNHGTFTNMDAATDWVVSSGTWGVEFSNAADVEYVNTGSDILKYTTNSQLTLYVDAIFTTADTAVHVCGERTATPAVGGFLFTRQTATELRFTVLGVWSQNSSAVTLTTGVRYGIAVTYDRVNVSFYVNGTLLSQHARTDAIGACSQPFVFGAGYSAPDTPGEGADVIIRETRVYQRALPESFARLLTSKSGIAYETAQRRSRKAASGAAAARRHLNLLGVGR